MISSPTNEPEDSSFCCQDHREIRKGRSQRVRALNYTGAGTNAVKKKAVSSCFVCFAKRFCNTMRRADSEEPEYYKFIFYSSCC